jgi:alkanesulfonate monooxygenase SsuD/methylene tetrahydromethanopterin reductase-like flavin-dependent oxidoreductase (luciferase family)
MGVDIRYRPSMFEQSLEIIRRLWAGETVASDGHWRLEGSRIAPLPPEPVEVWIRASARVAIDRAARLGDVWLGEPGMDLATAERRLATYRDACERHGRRPSTIAIRRDIHVGETSQDARSTIAPYIERGYRGFPPEALVFGSVAEVADQIAALGRAGFTDVIVRNISTDQRQALATIERLAEVRERIGA